MVHSGVVARFMDPVQENTRNERHLFRFLPDLTQDFQGTGCIFPGNEPDHD